MIDIRGKVSAEAIPGIPRSKEDILNNIIREIWGVSFNDMKIKSRKESIRLPRQLSMVILKMHGFSAYRSAEMFLYNHATVFHSAKTIRNIIDTKFPTHDYNRIIATFDRYGQYFEDFDLYELQRIGVR